MNIEKINLSEKLESISDYWNPRIAGELNNQLVKIAKVKGDFVMHNHENEDELFFVLEGILDIEMEDKTLTLNKGEMVIIPKGVNHRPFSENGASIMLFEPKTTLNTGNINNEMTKTELAKI